MLFFKRYVLRFSLKTTVVCGAFRWSGRAFHSLGAAAEKADSPWSLVLGGLRVCADAERREREVDRVDVGGVLYCQINGSAVNRSAS